MSDEQLLVLTYASVILSAFLFCRFIPQIADTLLGAFGWALSWI